MHLYFLYANYTIYYNNLLCVIYVVIYYYGISRNFMPGIVRFFVSMYEGTKNSLFGTSVKYAIRFTVKYF